MNDKNKDAVRRPTLTPRQVKQLHRLRSLAQEMLAIADDLEKQLITKEAERRMRAAIEPSAEAFARMAQLRRKMGLPNG